MVRGIHPEAKIVLRRWFPQETLDNAKIYTWTKKKPWFISKNASAVTLDEHTIVVFSEGFDEVAFLEDLGILAHELCHCEQVRKMGSFIDSVIYWFWWLGISVCFNRDEFSPKLYRYHPMEREATDLMIEVLQELGEIELANHWQRWIGEPEVL